MHRPRELRVIVWPFHDGLPDVGMGAGSRLLAEDRQLLEAIAGAPRVEFVAPADQRRPEIARVFELDRRLARHVAAAASSGAFPLVLAGQCASCLGTTAGLPGDEPLGAVWLDAHADFDTPEDNLSGFLDVMALSTLTGRAWPALRATIPGFAPVAEGDVVLAGVRDLEPYQRERLGRSAIRTVPGRFATGDLESALDDLRTRVARAYLHVDLDVLDSAVARANEYAAPDGPGLDDVLRAVDAVFDRFEVQAAALTAYDPDAEAGDATRPAHAAARRIVSRIAERATAPATATPPLRAPAPPRSAP